VIEVIEVIDMLRKAPAMTVRQNLGELLNEVQYRHNTILITKADKPIAALVDINLFNRIRLVQEKFDQMTDELASSYSAEETEEALNEIIGIVETIRHS